VATVLHNALVQRLLARAMVESDAETLVRQSHESHCAAPAHSCLLRPVNGSPSHFAGVVRREPDYKAWSFLRTSLPHSADSDHLPTTGIHTALAPQQSEITL
jgi:hypothetical protein